MLHAPELDVRHEQASRQSELLLATLKAIQDELGTMRKTLEHVDCTANNNARRLEVINNRLGSQTPERPIAASNTHENTRFNVAVAAGAVAGILLLSPRLRRLTQRSLKSMPLPLLGLAQLASAGALLAYRGRDLARSSGIISSAGEDSALRRRLAYLVLLASISAVPAKGLAHLLPDARRKRLVLA